MTPETMTSISSDSDSETGSSKNHFFHRRRNERLLPSHRSVVPIILSAPPAKLSWFSSFSTSSSWESSNKCCAVCGQLPPAGTIAIPFGPRIVRKRKTPLPPHFVLVKVKEQRDNNELLMQPNGNEEEDGRNTIVCCCRECVDFFRSIVVCHRDQNVMPEASPQLECIDGTENCSINIEGEKRCPSCWLDRCLLAGLTAQAVANWASNGDRARVEELDASFQRRRTLLRSLQNSKKMSTFQIVDERVLEFSLLKSLSYADEQFMTLRLACSASGRIIRLFRMFEHCTIRDLTGTGPILIGSALNQKRFLFDILCPQSDAITESCHRRFDCVFPTYSDGDQPQFDSSEYVTVSLENNDPFLTHIFFTLVDVFMCIELAQTLPVFRLLDTKDVILQLASSAMHCRMLTQACFSASLDAPELIHPGGILPHRTLMSVVRKAWNLILKKMIHFDLKKQQESAYGTRNNADEVVERVPVKVLAAPQLLSELEQCSQKNCVDLLKPFSNAKLSATEVLLLRVLILTSPNTPGLSESARLLLGVEWNKYVKLLRSHLRAELGSSEAEHRHSELIGLLDTVVKMRALAHRIMQLSFQIFDVPVHCHQPDGPNISGTSSSKQRSFPAYMKECRQAYETSEMQCSME